MRQIKHLVIHCTATSQEATVTAIKNYWSETLKWKNPGYHHLIDKNGKISNLQPIEKSSNGVAGHNSHSIHISYVGGLKVDDRTEAQKLAILLLLKKYKAMFPDAIILGHRDFPNVKKSCPRFDAKKEYRDINNI